MCYVSRTYRYILARFKAHAQLSKSVGKHLHLFVKLNFLDKETMSILQSRGTGGAVSEGTEVMNTRKRNSSSSIDWYHTTYSCLNFILTQLRCILAGYKQHPYVWIVLVNSSYCLLLALLFLDWYEKLQAYILYLNTWYERLFD